MAFQGAEWMNEPKIYLSWYFLSWKCGIELGKVYKKETGLWSSWIWIHWTSDTGTIVGISWAGPKDSHLSA